MPYPVKEEAAQARATTTKWWAFVGLLLFTLTAYKLHRFWRDRFDFDDAYMYSRYAFNFRHGWGIAWNPGGPHTFGLTSLPWFFVILLGSYFVHDNATLLTAASCTTGIVAIVSLCILTSRLTKSSSLRNPWLLLPAIGLVLLLNWRFDTNWCNGMETMLAMLAVTLFLAAHHKFQTRAGSVSLLVLVLASTFCILVRPELFLITASMPALAMLFKQSKAGWERIWIYFALLGLLLTAILLVNKNYFGTPVPLAFYLKAMHGYDGYRLVINPWGATAIFFSIALPFMAGLAGLARKKHFAVIATYLLPVVLVVAYLSTVTQIMGGQARYYLPLLPLVMLPALLVLDDTLATRQYPSLTPRRFIALCIVILSSREYTQGLTKFAGQAIARTHTYYAPPEFLPNALPKLPEGLYWSKSASFSRQLPAGTTMAASEVGILGASAPQVQILDLAGLNNAHLAQHPSDVSYVLSQNPDVIWLPHPDYTKFYGSLASAPRLLADYDLYAGAFDFGLAIRKSSASRPAFMEAVERGWDIVYPGYPMHAYLVQQVRWDPARKIRGTGANVLD